MVAVVPLLMVLAVVGVTPAISQLWAIPLLFFLVLLVAGLGIAFSAANLYFRDVKYIVEVLLTFAIFFTPVFYSSELFGPWRDWILLNPVAPLLEGLEQAVDKGRTPDLGWTAYSAVLATLIFAGAWLMFHRLEPSFADNV
jgi:ABC-type polysaccharide/polyol phosphate export permease